MNGKQERTDGRKSWDLSNWGLNKEDIQQTQGGISQKHNELGTDTIQNETQSNNVEIDSNDGR